MFKDIYILLAFKQIWSMIHSNIDSIKAKFIYGIMFSVGGLGSIFGGIISGFFAVKLKSHNLLLFSIPIYLVVSLLYYLASKQSVLKRENFKNEIMNQKWYSGGFSLIKNSKYLKFILVIVIFMQLSAAFLDYQYNMFLESHIPDIDLRTQYAGKITSIINVVTITFQLIGGILFIQFLGFKRSHALIPSILIVNAVIFGIMPSFFMATFAFVSVKVLDYSVFSILRELLYTPLKIDEKYRAKAVIDVFAYRGAKAFASIFLIFLQNIKVVNILLFISIISMVIYLIWTRIIATMFKIYPSEDILKNN